MSGTTSTELKTDGVNDNRFMQFCQLAAKGMHCLQVDSIGKPHRSLIKIKMENSSSLILKTSFVKIKIDRNVKIQNGCKTEGLKKTRKHLPEQLCFSITSDDAEVGIIATDLLQKELWMHGFPLINVDTNYLSQFSGFYLKEVTRRSSARKSVAASSDKSADSTNNTSNEKKEKHLSKNQTKPKVHRRKSSYKKSHKKKARSSRTSSKPKALDRSNYMYMDAAEKNNHQSKTMKKSLSGMIRSNVTNTFSKLRTKTKTKRKRTMEFDGVRDMIFQMEDNQQLESNPISTKSHATLPSVF